MMGGVKTPFLLPWTAAVSFPLTSLLIPVAPQGIQDHHTFLYSSPDLLDNIGHDGRDQSGEGTAVPAIRAL